MRAKRLIALSAMAAIVWAVPSVGTAHSLSRHSSIPIPSASLLPHPAKFRVEQETGLLVRVWLDGKGPFVFAIDTGAGLNVITEEVARSSGLQIRTVRPLVMGVLSSARISSNREAVIAQMALGEVDNSLPSQKTAIIVPALAPGIDGILDPTDSYSPLGYLSTSRIKS